MTTPARSTSLVAGVIHATCTCCPSPAELVNHVAIGATRMVCPSTRRTYLDRGDGLFQPDGQLLSEAQMRAPAPAPQARVVETTAETLLSDRPTRTAEKTRINLERATFA